MKKKSAGLLMGIVLSAAMMAGCGGQTVSTSSTGLSAAAESEPAQENTENSESTENTSPDAISAQAVSASSEDQKPEGEMKSYLTGLTVDSAIGLQRPFTIMINNLQPAVPQSGISDAEIIYEAEVEGSITRLMAVFQDPTKDTKIGPVRSARHYYIYLSDDNEGIYTHFGWSPQAEQIITDQGLQHINGQEYDGAGPFFRTTDRVAPHNAYADGSQLPDIASQKGYSRDYPDGYQPNLLFNDEDTPLSEGEDANRIDIGFSYDEPYFIYNADDGLYYRYEYGDAQVDAENGEQLKFKNIVIQQESQVLMDDDVHLDMTLFGVSDGTGYYATDGKIIPITWKKDSQSDRTRYYDMNGNQLSFNPGKTMFEVINRDYTNTWSAGTEAAADTGETS